MPDPLWSGLFTFAAIVAMFLVLVLGWMLYALFFYCRGLYYYRRHLKRKAKKKIVRAQEENFRNWKRKNETKWTNYQFQYQTAVINAKKIPGDWAPDTPLAPPCEPPPAISLLPEHYKNWEDIGPWLPPSNFFKYWCVKTEKFLREKENFDTQHIMMKKTNDEYHEWKRKHAEDVQRAIKNHPIASTFLNLNKSF